MCGSCASRSTYSPQTLIRHLPAAGHPHLATILQVGYGLSSVEKLPSTQSLLGSVTTEIAAAAVATTITAAIARLPFSTCAAAAAG